MHGVRLLLLLTE